MGFLQPCERDEMIWPKKGGNPATLELTDPAHLSEGETRERVREHVLGASPSKQYCNETELICRERPPAPRCESDVGEGGSLCQSLSFVMHGQTDRREGQRIIPD